jgi:hypothetical protein
MAQGCKIKEATCNMQLINASKYYYDLALLAILDIYIRDRQCAITTYHLIKHTIIHSIHTTNSESIVLKVQNSSEKIRIASKITRKSILQTIDSEFVVPPHHF